MAHETAVYRSGMATDRSADDWVRIEELAARAQMTVRNVRAHRSRGLLPPPRMVGRTGFYGPHHQRRLEQIKQMQDEGLNLAAISRVLIDGRLTDAAAGVFREAEGERVDLAGLAERLGTEADAAIVDVAIDAGVLIVDDGELRIGSPRLLGVAERLSALGVPLPAQLEAASEVRRAAARVAETFMELADEHLIAAVAIDTRGDLAAIEAAAGQLHALAREALQAVFDREMSDAIEAYFEESSEPVDRSSS